MSMMMCGGYIYAHLNAACHVYAACPCCVFEIETKIRCKNRKEAIILLKISLSFFEEKKIEAKQAHPYAK
jgi:hypothetical protein